ncbi:MAG: carbohydrate kinase, partial [Planctomycetes bacterium]|nr:carbohydrate kinase [Planctomycetota bacterium]
MPKYLLGIDNGATMSKAALFSLAGDELAAAAEKTEMLTPAPGHTERDTEGMWQATAGAIRRVLADAKIAPEDIACVSCTGHGNGLYLVDKEGNPVRNAVISTDSRAKDYIARWQEAGVGEAVLPKTTQSLWPGQPNALLAWIRDNEPDVMRRAGWVLMAKDYTRFRLTGNIAAELTDMSGTSLMSVRDGVYDDEILEAFGLADMRPLLPPLVRSEEICGEVTAEAAEATGLVKGTPVAGGMFDIDACGLAAGMVDQRQMILVAGTWGNNQYVDTKPLADKGLFMTSCYSIPGYYLMLEGSPTSASNLEWFVTQFFQAERAAAEASGSSVYELCNDLVAATSPEDTSLTFLPFLFGSNDAPDAKACLLGLAGWHTRGHVLRAIYEGVVFAHRAHVERLLQFRDPPEAIRFTGGPARSETWVQIFADCLQLPIEIPAGTELGALGAAIAGAVAAGCYGSYAEAVAAMTKTARVHQPDPAKRDLYDAKYA